MSARTSPAQHHETQWLKKLGRILRSLLVAPVFLSLLMCFTLLSGGQFQEIYLRAEEPGREPQLFLGFLTTALLATSLLCGYLSSWYILRQTGIGIGRALIYRSYNDLTTDRRIVQFRNGIATFCALLPMLAIALGFLQAAENLQGYIQIYNKASNLLALDQPADSLPASMPSRLRWIALFWCIGSFALAVLLNIAVRLRFDVELRWRKARMGMPKFIHWLASLLLAMLWPLIRFIPALRENLQFDVEVHWRAARTRMPQFIHWFASLMLVIPWFLLQQFPDLFDDVFHFSGSLATLGLVLTMITTGLFFIGKWSRKFGVPIILLATTAFFGVGIVKWVLTGATPGHNSAFKEMTARDRAASLPPLQQEFEDWLLAREDLDQFEKIQRPYPVFIIAAQGGGIYAASAVGSLLAKLQDNCKNFSQHIFAISAVSGGAIGSSVFQSLMTEPGKNSGQVKFEDCWSKSGNTQDVDNNLQRRVRKVMRDDHLAPTIAATVPGLASKAIQVILYEILGLYSSDIRGRAKALECSFARSFQRSSPQRSAGRSSSWTEVCTTTNNSGLNKTTFADWRVLSKSAAPSLVLNTTWAETGDRVAFAPFRFRGRVGDDTLVAFNDFNQDIKANDVKLVEAAITSARFPAILSAKILRPDANSAKINSQRRWWNFVDGGYADASGVTTALEIYEALKTLENDKLPIKPDIRLIILTNAIPTTSLTDKTGHGLIHAISPLTTLMTIRAQTARRAIARAEKAIHEEDKHQSCEDDGWKVRRVTLDQENFSLPLGWMLSDTTENLVARLVGDLRFVKASQELGKFKSSKKTKSQRAADILFSNSCTLHSITRLLSGADSGLKPSVPVAVNPWEGVTRWSDISSDRGETY